MSDKTTDKRLLDRDWRLANLYKITSKDEKIGQIKFVPNKAQRVILEALKKYNRIIILKSRQLGITTFFCLLNLDKVLFEKNVNALTILHKKEDAIEAFDGKVRYAWENFNEKLQAVLGWTVSTERAGQLKFGFGKGEYSKYAVSTSGRSGTFHSVHVSELGTLDADRPLDAKELVTGTFPAVPEDGLIAIESTAKGEDGRFPSMWDNAVEGKSVFHPIFLNWRYDEEEIAKAPLLQDKDLPKEFIELKKLHKLTQQEVSYYYKQFLTLDRDWTELRQEFPTTAEEAFQGSGEKMFDTKSIDEYLEGVVDGEVSGNAIVYHAPIEGRKYVIAADPAEGTGNDHSAMIVFEIGGSKPRVVLDYISNTIEADDFALFIAQTGKMYNMAYIIPERNSVGIAVISKLKTVYDEELIYRQKDESEVIVGSGSKYGFRTTGLSKPRILTGANSVLRDKSVIIESKRVLKDMRACPKKEMTRTSSKDISRHFDLTMAFALGIEFIKTEPELLYIPSTKTKVSKPEVFDPYAAI